MPRSRDSSIRAGLCLASLTPPSGSGAGLWRFAARETGSITVFSVFVLTAMLLMAGLALDMLRYENTRIRMQNTADRAALAAATLRSNDADTTPEALVEAYFAAEGLGPQLSGRVQVVEDAAQRTVTVVPSATIRASTLGLLGLGDFSMVTPAQATGITEEFGLGDTRLDVVMVLDVSGSMNSQGRLEAMRDAASDLTRTLLRDNDEGNTALTVVPYNNWVLPPPGFLNHFTALSGQGACADWTQWFSLFGSRHQNAERQRCATDVWAQISAFQDDADMAVERIGELRARGNTSIDLGIRFGSMFFDPDLQPVVRDMIANGQVDPAFDGRPFAWDEPDVMRVLILLTDGVNCCGRRASRFVQDADTSFVCEALKERGILLYTVAFQAPRDGASLMRACASTENHYFNADVSEIQQVFRGIGTHIRSQALRLSR